MTLNIMPMTARNGGTGFGPCLRESQVTRIASAATTGQTTGMIIWMFFQSMAYASGF